ncbi:unnamed protein product [Rotaria sordida]|uniref:Uncharacterized protein n=1 Tax=Rotaria sordida TaxID=392033 RepID=A0A814CDU2_9BILA|nr:unnamed protein product [Rotaria sordida]
MSNTLYDLVHVLYTHNERDTIAESILLRVIIPPNAQARVMFETSFVGGQCATLIEKDNNHLVPNVLFFYVNVLIIDCEHDINLHYFENIRYLCIYRLNYELLIQMDSNTLPYLEHLSIKCVPSSVIHLLDTLFSKNIFSNLQSFYVNTFKAMEPTGGLQGVNLHLLSI